MRIHLHIIGIDECAQIAQRLRTEYNRIMDIANCLYIETGDLRH